MRPAPGSPDPAPLVKRSLVPIAALVGALCLWWLVGREAPRASMHAAPAAAPAPAAPAPAAALERASQGAAVAASRGAVPREAVAPPAPAGEDVPPQTAAAPEPEPSLFVRGRVVDRAGAGVPRVPLVRTGQANAPSTRAIELATSGPDGSFAAELPAFRGDDTLAASPASPWATLRAARVRAEDPGDQLVVVAPAVALAGAVVEAGGGPLAGATVRFRVPVQALIGFPAPLDGTVAADAQAVSGADGRFALARAPAAPGARLQVEHAGFRALDEPAPDGPRDDLLLALERLGEDEPWLLGVVVRPDGTPARGARVRLGALATRTDEDGRFGLARAPEEPEAPLVAALVGRQPAVLPRAGELLRQEFPPPLVRLVLGARALSIRGVVLDAEGLPLPRWRVGLVDGTVLGPNRIPAELAEDLARGKEVQTETDAQGRFVLGGLLERDYVVQAFDAGTLLMLRTGPVPAGTRDLVLRVPADALVARVTGVVVARDGAPLAGVRVGSALTTSRNGGASEQLPGRSVLTGADGRFALEQVPRRLVELTVSGEDVIPQAFALDPERDLRLTVARRLHFRVALGPAAGEQPPPDAIAVLDAAGAFLPLYLFQGNGWSSSSVYGLARLGTNALGVSEDAALLVFLRESAEVARTPLALAPDEVTVVRWPR